MIVPGATVFAWMDTHGLPLTNIVDGLRRNQLAFDVVGFVQAAKASGNFSRDALLARMTEAELYEGNQREEWEHLVRATVEQVYA